MTFTPTDTTDYNTVAGTVTVTVNKATPTVTALPTASAISVGQTLASSTLTGGSASAAALPLPARSPGPRRRQLPPLGTDSESVTFTPTDTTDYNTVTVTVTVTVNNKTTPTVTALPTASAITYGQTLASSTLTGAAPAFRCRHVRLDHADDSSRCGYASGERDLYAHRYDRLQHGDRYSHGYGEQGDTDGDDLADSQRHLCRPGSVRVDADGRHGSVGGTAVPGTFAWTTPTTVPVAVRIRRA